ncbi:WD40 repeat-like protein [Mycena sanguinolenta]|uniref:WD40 repeat-like protein n=1 Tax=Mycena sanguinolenta TaxID=230812 RepID=A0A8H7CF29_9AGAR|nr:WD40 repeat-like protein [Mycena sanguinolenta]
MAPQVRENPPLCKLWRDNFEIQDGSAAASSSSVAMLHAEMQRCSLPQSLTSSLSPFRGCVLQFRKPCEMILLSFSDPSRPSWRRWSRTLVVPTQIVTLWPSSLMVSMNVRGTTSIKKYCVSLATHSLTTPFLFDSLLPVAQNHIFARSSTLGLTSTFIAASMWSNHLLMFTNISVTSFLRIHREHSTIADIPLPWPSPAVLQQLVDKSSGHFIYASTIIKFIDDKSYRPTERLEMVQDPDRSGSEPVFETLDQLYITILCSAPRQSQLIPILCAIAHFPLAAGDIDQLFGNAKGETRLLLRGLHSVLNVPRDNQHRILPYHASFVDFLKHPNRSGDFCVGILNRRVSLACYLLQFFAGPFQRNICRLSRLIDFIVSLPPCGLVAELFPLIRSMNADYIFAPKEYQSEYNYFEAIVSWLKNNPSAPPDVIQLWEDYGTLSPPIPEFFEFSYQ